MGRLRIVMLSLALIAGACGNSNDESAGSGGTSETTMEAHAADPAMTTDAPTTGASPTCAPQGNALALIASGTMFDVGCLAAPAGQAFTIAVDNKDSVAHNLAILESHEAEDVLFRGDIFQGPKSTTYQVPALKAGTYAFHCEVHPGTMKGTFVVA